MKFYKNLKGGGRNSHRTSKTASMLVLTLIFAMVLCGVVSAADNNVALNTTHNGTVSGDLYVNATQPVAFADQPADATSREFNQTFDLPTNSSAGGLDIEWAQVYVNIYSGSGSNNWPLNATILLDGDGDGIYETTLGTELLTSENYSTDGTQYWINDHCFRVYSDYQLWYDVTGLITCTNPSIYVKTEQVETDPYDGRLKMIALVVAYNDGDSDKVDYWVNSGQDWISSGSTSSTTFNTSTVTATAENATLNAVTLSSKDGTYTFNGTTHDGTNPVAPVNYFITHIWDVTSQITAGSDSTLNYTAGSGSFKSVLATLTIREGAVLAPEADFTADTTNGISPLTVNFTDTSTGTITSWSWDFNNDGTVDSTLQNPTYTYNDEGTYTVNLTVTGPCGTTTETKTDYITVTANPLADAPWPTFGRDLSGTGQSPYNGTEISNLAWTYSTGGAISSDSSATIGADGTIYVGSTDKNLYALNPDGTLKWTFTTGGSVYTPTIGADGTIYVGSTDKNLYALNPDGTLKWSYTVGGSIKGAAKIGTDGTIYAAGGGLYALNPDGTLKWSYSAGSYTPVIGTDGTIYVNGGGVYALNPDGTLKWSYSISSDGSPAIGPDGTIYIGSKSYGSGLVALNSDGTLKWTYGIFGNDYITSCSPVVGADGTIYIGTIGGYIWSSNFFAINPDGTLKWEYTAGLPSYKYIVASAAIDADGTIYIGCTDGKLYALNSDGTLKWTYATGSAIKSSPSIGSDGTIYIGSSNGNLYALNIIAPVANFTANVVSDYAPLTVQFTDTSTENPSAWEWDFNNDGIIDSTEQNPTYTYTETGTYTVCLTVSNEKGSNSLIMTDYITVTTPPDDTECPTVTASPTGGDFNSAVQVTLTATDNYDNWPKIYYTTDGTDPTTESTQYTSAITLSNTTILKFIAADRSGNISPVQTETYNVADTEAPVVDAVQDWTTVTLSATDNADPNPTIYYTTDGTDPTTSSTPYSAPFSIPRAAITIVKFIAVDVSGNTSPVGSETFSTIKSTDLLTGYYAEGNIGLVISNGGTGYTWFAHNTPGTGTVTYTSSDLNIPEGANILSARLYQAWTWYGYPEYTVQFNGYDIPLTVQYVDGNDGQNIYDVTSYFNANGDNTAVITSGGGASYATILIIVYQSDSEPYRKIWLNEGYDIMYTNYGATNGPGYALFNNVTDSSVVSAQIIALLPSGDNDSPDISINGQNISASERGGSDPSFLYYNVTDALQNGSNEMEIEGGSYFSLQNAVMVLTMQSDIVAGFTSDIISGTAPLTVQFTDQTTDATGWSWDFDNDGTVDSTEQNPTWTYTAPGNYTVKLTVTGSGGIDEETKTDYISVIFTPWHDSCDSLDDWTVLGASLNTSKVYEGSASISGNSAGSNVSAERTINITEGAVTLRFDATANTSYSYNCGVKVYFDGEEMFTIPLNGNWNLYSIDLTGVEPGEHILKIEAYSETWWGPAAFYIDNIWVINDEEVFSKIVIQPDTVNMNENDTHQFSAQAYTQYDEKLSKTFTWTSSDETVGTIDTNGLFTALSPGTTTITATADDINGTSVITVNYPLPTADFTVDKTSGYVTLNVQFTDQSTDATGWSWDFDNNGTVDSTEQNPTWNYTEPGNYTVNLTVTNPSGTDTETKTDYINVTLPPDTEAPIVSADPVGGSYNTSKTVTLTGTDNLDTNVDIYYTLDGSTPTTDSTLYTSPINIDANTMLKFIGVDDTGNSSDVQTETYTVDTEAPSVSASVGTGIFGESQNVILTGTDNLDTNPDIYYTTDGTIPTTMSTLYTSPITIYANTVLKFFAVDEASNYSLVQSKTYIIDTTAPVGNVDLVGGVYNSTLSVVLSAKDNIDAHPTIYYTLNGDTPTTSSTQYTEPISIDSTTTLQFIAVDLFGNVSPVQTETYTINTDTTAPTITTVDPANGTTSLNGDESFTVTFSEDIMEGTNWIELVDGSGTAIPFTMTVNGNVLTITPTSDLLESAYKLMLHTGSLTDLAGNLLVGKSFRFSVGTAPTITTVDPVNGSTNVSVDKSITVTFSEAIRRSSKFWVELVNSTGEAIPFTTTIIDNVLTITPTSDLAEDKYKLMLHTGSVTDIAGNLLAGQSFRFSVGTSPTITSTNPADGAINVHVAKTITVTFSEAIRRSSKFWVELVDSNGASVEYTSYITSGNILVINPTLDLAANTVYKLKIHTGSVTDMAGNLLAAKVISFTTRST